MLIALQLTATPQGPLSGEPVRSFDAEQLTIGRAPNCNMVLPDGLRIISRHHARLTQQAGKVRLTCLSASAPVRVNETSVPHGGALALRSGDVIHIGGFELRFAADVDEPVAMEPTAAPVASVAAVVARSPAAPPAAIAPPAVAPLPVPVPVVGRLAAAAACSRPAR